LNIPVNILLVDDEPRNLDVLESILDAPDYHLVRAQTAESALLLLLDTEFAAIVLDIQMPEMSGIELANLIKQRKRTQHIPIIFLTAYYQDEKDVLQGYGSGAVDYLTKPVRQEILRSKVSVFVELFRKTRALAAINDALEAEIVQRQAAEAALQKANNDLEARVLERTADLNQANAELRESEAALRKSEAQAMAASRAKDDFLAALSHELRTPLNPVLLLATESAANAELSPAVRETFQTIATNVALEARLIDDMLDLTRITHGKLVLEMRPVDVEAVLRHALSLAGSEIERKEIRITARLEAKRRMVEGDEVRLKQVFWNVLENAAKFTPAGGEITVETAEIPETAEISIRITDTGIGMTEAELCRIFEPFSQGDHARETGNHRFGGMGLGLAIAKVMVKRHQGTISASSPGRNRGTAFVIKLPLAPSQAVPEAGPKKPTGRERTGKPCRILLVEDHKSTSAALSNLLTRRSHRVVAAANVAEARAAAEREDFDILISDIGLPDGNGYELMTELGNRSGLVGIALSGYGMPVDVSRSQAAGFASHLVKPVSIEMLDLALAEACQRTSSA
jgi:signal transduction histidine kinase